MTGPPLHVHPSDLLGYGRLAIDATAGLADLVETMHGTIVRAAGLGTPAAALTAGAASVVYSTVRAVTRLMGGGLDVLAPFLPMLDEIGSPAREAVLAAVNGVMGDHLAATDNPLAIQMRMRRSGRPLRLERQDLAAAIPQPGGNLLVLVHGLCMNDLQWTRNGHNHGAALAGELGWTPVQLHYNSGLHVSTNGRGFAGLLDKLVTEWPVRVRRLVIVAHSSGGLVSRSAYHYGMAAGHRWPQHLRKIVFLGTPHHGSPLERGGNWVNILLGLSRYSAPLAAIARIRSAGITDLRHGNLLDEDWKGTDRFHHAEDLRRPVPLPAGVRCATIAASIGKDAGNFRHHLLGDGLVSVNSALGRHEDTTRHLSFGDSHQWVGHGMNHWDLLSHPAVYQRIRKWIA